MFKGFPETLECLYKFLHKKRKFMNFRKASLCLASEAFGNIHMYVQAQMSFDFSHHKQMASLHKSLNTCFKEALVLCI